MGCYQKLPHCTCNFRVFGLVSGTAKTTNRNHRDKPQCERCGGEEAAQRHLALDCPKTAELRALPKFGILPRVHPFTVCTGTPCRTELWAPMESSNIPLTFPREVQGHATLFTDGFASPPEFAAVRLSTWSVIKAEESSHNFECIHSGMTPDSVHTIARPETFAVFTAIRHTSSCEIYVDNQGALLNLNRINQECHQPLAWKNQVNGDLWQQIAQLVVSKPAGPLTFLKLSLTGCLVTQKIPLTCGRFLVLALQTRLPSRS